MEELASLVIGSGSDCYTEILGSKVFVHNRYVKTDADGVLIGLKPTLSGSLVTAAEKNVLVGNNTSPESLLSYWSPCTCRKTLSHSFTSLKATCTITHDSH
ncbi:hypothetical protein BLNAU_8607 [Blattamonas nauphoetae]|uniref:Uncharacterized protein n=1 Tax=Blattamonas nauphoetae TaxID=2049346 RepID=A0ABQ9XY11_9EUKA|nr:hypothetical protein BLNAU_8607 [Blattamonas nauphoetae]